MTNFIAHNMLDTTLTVQSKLANQILRERHDVILDNYLLNIRQNLISRQTKELCSENVALKTHCAADFPEILLKYIYRLESAKETQKSNVVKYFENVQFLLCQIANILLDIVKFINTNELEKYEVKYDI